MTSQTEIVWAGRGPLTDWPECDWYVLLHPDRGFMPIWDRAPLTASTLWARWMSGRDGRDTFNERPFAASSTPMLTDVDRMDRLEQFFARRLREIEGQKPTPVATAQATPRPITIKTDEPEREAGFDGPRCSLSGKIRHKSKLWALAHRGRLAALPDERHPEQLMAYKCKGCGDWHVGHRV